MKQNETTTAYKDTLFCDGASDEAIRKAARILREGGLVAFPTETVYGLGADALNADAAAKIYAAKGRPSDNPLIVHIADTADIYKLAVEVPSNAVLLAEAFWPGPLTVILPKKSIVPDQTTGGLQTVAIRMPSHPAALALIRESGIYIAAPSANTSGRPSPTTAEHVLEDMQGRIDMILDGGPVGIGIESTIVDLTGDVPTILRPGFITKTMLSAIVGEVAVDRALTDFNPALRPKAPGMKYTHYAPAGELTIIETACPVDTVNALVREKEAAGQKTAVLASAKNADRYKCENVIVLGPADKGETVAANLYGALRKCDALGVSYIYSESFYETELGGAIMNRLLKAAGHRVIKDDDT